MACRSGCCCGFGPFNEDNARFLMLAVFIILYLLCGAAVFSALEQPMEAEAKDRWAQRFEQFSQNNNLNKKELDNFLRNYEEANVAGIRVDTIRPRWDFTGAFYFVGTVVSTIGFGMTTPATISGKIFLIFYGLIGCASTILFFNLFLERVITVIAFVLKSCHERRHLRKAVLPQNGRRRLSEGSGGGGRGGRGGRGEGLAGWKPSVYCVMLILGAAAILVSCCASAMYSAVEGWGYLDSLYYCFVAFSTIGFGDMVSSQKFAYDEGNENQTAYRVGNFLFILTGVCCIYSLFNVISIVIKQVLNWLLRRLEVPCRCPGRGGHHPHPRHPRRNVVVPGHMRARRDLSIETDAVNESEADGRRMSGEMISMKDFLAANKVNLAIMQKQLSEMANGHPRQSGSSSRHNGFSGGVGALGIMNNRLAETSVDR
ncbi:potassium channel subfamily K member 13-like [Coregonus clupeaformis]|uniref:Potassium channel domain-containing protein n=1 Tax=Coregonus suidteri TaxID=861788 RepID=A0AAN8L0L9_9TELE|nr:potassium channel subfamily K member 13-like [Coregonus clupeaformis]